MIATPIGWSSRYVGDELVLVPPDGAGTLRYAERLRPIRSARSLAASLGYPSGFTPTRVGDPQREITYEGEHAEIIEVDGVVAGANMQLTFGFVFLDDCYSRLVGVAVGPRMGEMRSTVKRLLIADRQFAGSLRRRRFEYEPPPGWQAVEDTFTTTWYPHDHDSRIVVSSAIPSEETLALHTLAAIVGGREHRITATHAIRHPHLQGQQVTLAMAGIETHVAILRDSRFQYTVRLDGAPGHAEKDLPVLAALIDSIKPVPLARRQPDAKSVVSHWID